MNILALDTCTELCSVALLYERQVFRCEQLTKQGHTELILGMLDSVFKQAQTALNAVDLLAFGRGPGSFTGVRVGVGVAQGVAFARQLPVVPVSTLAAIAQQSIDEFAATDIAVAMDARMGEIYCAHFTAENGYAKLLDAERVCHPTDFLPLDDRPWHAAGTGWSIYAHELTSQFENKLSDVRSECYPTAASMITLAEQQAELGNTLSAQHALPVYLRDNVAKKKGEQ